MLFFVSCMKMSARVGRSRKTTPRWGATAGRTFSSGTFGKDPPLIIFSLIAISAIPPWQLDLQRSDRQIVGSHRPAQEDASLLFFQEAPFCGSLSWCRLVNRRIQGGDLRRSFGTPATKVGLTVIYLRGILQCSLKAALDGVYVGSVDLQRRNVQTSAIAAASMGWKG